MRGNPVTVPSDGCSDLDSPLMAVREIPARSVLLFMSKVRQEGTCWLWEGAVNSKGYPAVWLEGKTFLSHRISYLWFVGGIAEGEQIHHSCRNPLCVNPRHLAGVAASENRNYQANNIGDEVAPF